MYPWALSEQLTIWVWWYVKDGVQHMPVALGFTSTKHSADASSPLGSLKCQWKHLIFPQCYQRE